MPAIRSCTTPEHRQKIVQSLQRGKFDAIADPLWQAIHFQRWIEVAVLQERLAAFIKNEKLEGRLDW